jgi:hypothetical protein
MNNKNNDKVYKDRSQVINFEKKFIPGDGIFAKVDIRKNEKICSYSGGLIDDADTQYIDPTYLFDWQIGRGFKMLGDDEDGDLGHYINSTHPDSLWSYVNARLDKKSLKKTKSAKKFLERRFCIDIIANEDIEKDDEIIIDYGPGYWITMDNFLTSGLKEKPIATLERDARAEKRAASEDMNIAVKKQK